MAERKAWTTSAACGWLTGATDVVAVDDEDEGGGEEGGGGGDTPAWLPAGAVAYADFSAGHYYADGAETTPDTMLVTEGSNAGVTFNAAAIQDGVGYVGSNVQNRGGAFAGATLAAMVAGCTVVYAFTISNANGRIVGELIDQNYSTDISYTSHSGATTKPALTDFAGFNNNSSLTALGVGAHKLALTFDPANTHIAMTTDGEAVIGTSSAAIPVAVDEIYVAMNSAEVILISITIYPPQADADLPALSALT